MMIDMTTVQAYMKILMGWLAASDSRFLACFMSYDLTYMLLPDLQVYKDCQLSISCCV